MSGSDEAQEVFNPEQSSIDSDFIQPASGNGELAEAIFKDSEELLLSEQEQLTVPSKERPTPEAEKGTTLRVDPSIKSEENNSFGKAKKPINMIYVGGLLSLLILVAAALVYYFYFRQAEELEFYSTSNNGTEIPVPKATPATSAQPDTPSEPVSHEPAAPSVPAKISGDTTQVVTTTPAVYHGAGLPEPSWEGSAGGHHQGSSDQPLSTSGKGGAAAASQGGQGYQVQSVSVSELESRLNKSLNQTQPLPKINLKDSNSIFGRQGYANDNPDQPGNIALQGEINNLKASHIDMQEELSAFKSTVNESKQVALEVAVLTAELSGIVKEFKKDVSKIRSDLDKNKAHQEKIEKDINAIRTQISQSKHSENKKIKKKSYSVPLERTRLNSAPATRNNQKTTYDSNAPIAEEEKYQILRNYVIKMFTTNAVLVQGGTSGNNTFALRLNKKYRVLGEVLEISKSGKYVAGVTEEGTKWKILTP